MHEVGKTQLQPTCLAEWNDKVLSFPINYNARNRNITPEPSYSCTCREILPFHQSPQGGQEVHFRALLFITTFQMSKAFPLIRTPRLKQTTWNDGMLQMHV